MIKKQIKFFILRWIVSSFLMWICVKLFGRVDREVDTFGVFVTAGLVLSVVQTIVKPILTIFAQHCNVVVGRTLGSTYFYLWYSASLVMVAHECPDKSC